MMELIVSEEHFDEKYPADEKEDNLTGQNYDGITDQLHYIIVRNALEIFSDEFGS